MFELSKIIGHMGPVAMVVAVALMAMAVAALAVFLERLYAYARSRRSSRRFARDARALLEAGAGEDLAQRAVTARGSHLATVLGAGMRAFLAHRGVRAGQLHPVEAARRELDRRADEAAADVRRGMGVLASVGSVAPFVGLLGTVVGIIDAFQGIAKEGSGGLGAVSSGIAEALVVTALGLLVAIPSVLAFNFLTSQGEAILRAVDHARGELVDWLENHPHESGGHVGQA